MKVIWAIGGSYQQVLLVFVGSEPANHGQYNSEPVEEVVCLPGLMEAAQQNNISFPGCSGTPKVSRCNGSNPVLRDINTLHWTRSVFVSSSNNKT